jgi:hypothetical protein
VVSEVAQYISMYPPPLREGGLCRGLVGEMSSLQQAGRENGR